MIVSLPPMSNGGRMADAVGEATTRATPRDAGTATTDLRLVTEALGGSGHARRLLGARLECIPRFLHHRNEQMGRPLAAQELPDLAQDAKAIVWRKLPEYEGRARLDTWVFRICSFELMNRIRAGARHARVFTGEEDGERIAREPAREGRLPDRGLSRLPADEEAILRRKHYDERSFEEIGRELGLSPSGVKHRYYGALRHLRQLMNTGTEKREG